MTPRIWLYDILSQDSEFMGLLPGGLGEAGSRTSRPAEVPFALIVEGLRFDERMGGEVISIGIELWVHDQAGSYTRIDAALDRARKVLEAEAGDDTWRYEGRSRDFIDDAWNTLVKNDSWRVFRRET